MLVEDIQDIIEEKLMAYNHYQLAKAYITWSSKIFNQDKSKYYRSINKRINWWNSGIDLKFKNAVVTTQRDYLAGTNKYDLLFKRRFLIPKV